MPEITKVDIYSITYEANVRKLQAIIPERRFGYFQTSMMEVFAKILYGF